MQLEGKRALITGGGSGIGRSLAIEAAGRGVRLVLAGRRRQALDETLSALPGAGHLAIVADVTSRLDRQALMSEVGVALGRPGPIGEQCRRGARRAAGRGYR